MKESNIVAKRYEVSHCTGVSNKSSCHIGNEKKNGWKLPPDQANNPWSQKEGKTKRKNKKKKKQTTANLQNAITQKKALVNEMQN